MINTKGRTPADSDLPVGDVREVMHKQGNGKRVLKWRVQYEHLYFCYATKALATEKCDKFMARYEG